MNTDFIGKKVFCERKYFEFNVINSFFIRLLAVDINFLASIGQEIKTVKISFLKILTITPFPLTICNYVLIIKLPKNVAYHDIIIKPFIFLEHYS